MEYKNKKILKSSEEKYSLDKLWKDISAQYEEEEIESSADVMRDKCLKLKMISHLITLAGKIRVCEENEIYDVIKLTEEEHDAIFCYTFSLSINSQYDYSWSYLRKQWEGYLKMLRNVCIFINHVISYVSKLQQSKTLYMGLTFVFANIFTVCLDKNKNVLEVKVLWQSLDDLFQIGECYSISAKVDSTLLLSASANKDKDQFESFLGRVSKLYQSVK